MSAVLQDPLNAADAADEGGKSLADYLGVLRRRRVLMLAVAATLFAIALIVALVWPPTYRSTATILIQEQEIPQELVRSTVTSYADERIQVISQQVMTRSVLLDLVERYDLYHKARQRESSEEILDRMRRDIKLTPISADVTDRRTGSAVKSTIAFTLSYESTSPKAAQKVANELTTLFLNENVKNRQLKAAETSSFLQAEIARLNAYISDIEQKLSDFKRAHQGLLPEQASFNEQTREITENDLRRIDRDVITLQDKRIQLEGVLAQVKPNASVLADGGDRTLMDPEDRLKSLETQLSAATAVYSEDHPDVKRLRRAIAGLKAETGVVSTNAAPVDDRITIKETQLAKLRQQFSDDHPDVLKLKREIAALDQGAAASTSAPARKPDNPTYLTLKSQIESIDSEIAGQRALAKELRAKREGLEARLAQAPEVEREYFELAREQNSSHMRLREMLEKQGQAQVAEQLERDRKAERFTLIDPPIYPETPVSPNRGAIVLLGFVLALAGGGGAAGIAEVVDRTVHDGKQVTRVLRVPVLATIPTLVRPGDALRRTRRRQRLLLVGVGGLVVLLLAFHFLFMPLDVAWYGLLRRLSN